MSNSSAGGRGALRIDSRQLSLFALRYGIFVALLLLMAGMSAASEHFLTVHNLLNVARQAAPVIIIAVAMTFVMATAGIDLSVGSVVALTSSLSALWLADGLAPALVVPLALGVGAAVGLFNGYFVTRGLPPFVVTLSTLILVRGLAFVISDGYATPVANDLFKFIGRGAVGPIHTPIVIALVIALIGYLILSKTRFGLYALAIGGREEAARLMGIKIVQIKLLVYMATGALAAVAGVVITARLGNGSPNAGIALELEVIAAVVLGGTSLFGGSATIFGTVIGALFVNFVRNGLNLTGVNPFWVQVVTGLILLLAVWFNAVVNQRIQQWSRVAEEDLAADLADEM
ncbi:MAG: ABC transporter permease [Gammaproteobacteria bacterium]